MEADVRLISQLHSESRKKVLIDVKHEQRIATIQDIIFFLKEGYHIIGILDFISTDKKGIWSRKEGHAVVINGYARQKNWPSDLLYIFISDPSVLYFASGYPQFDQALIIKAQKIKNYPTRVGNLSFEGYSHMGLLTRAILSGLLVYKTK
jgi:hypothetical protein